jgi:hypothetical protein
MRVWERAIQVCAVIAIALSARSMSAAAKLQAEEAGGAACKNTSEMSWCLASGYWSPLAYCPWYNEYGCMTCCLASELDTCNGYGTQSGPGFNEEWGQCST